MPEAVKDVLKDLSQLERTTGLSGAIPNAPKAQLLDATDVEKKHPTKHLRWVNLQNSDKVESRKLEGYVRLTSEEGGRHLGDSFALFAIPREKYEARVQRQERENSRRLLSHESDMGEVVEGIARIMRDKYGIRIDTKRLLINEG